MLSGSSMIYHTATIGPWVDSRRVTQSLEIPTDFCSFKACIETVTATIASQLDSLTVTSLLPFVFRSFQSIPRT